METPHPEVPWNEEDLTVQVLDGQPAPGFDCGEEAQNNFLYRRAWRDMKAGVTVTHLLYVKGMLAGYVTLFADKVGLGEGDVLRGVYWNSVPAVKIGQLAVDRRFAGQGLGAFLIGYTVEQVHRLRRWFGCRVLSLDAHPELAPWYQLQGFEPNVQEQRERVARAQGEGRDPGRLGISMRFDLGVVRR